MTGESPVIDPIAAENVHAQARGQRAHGCEEADRPSAMADRARGAS